MRTVLAMKPLCLFVTLSMAIFLACCEPVLSHELITASLSIESVYKMSPLVFSTIPLVDNVGVLKVAIFM